jgi:hypothetical protein
MPDVVDQTSQQVGDEGGNDSQDASAKPDQKPGDEGKGTSPPGGSGDEAGEGKIDVESILDEYGLESPDELKDWLNNMQSLKGRIGDADFDEIVDGFETLKSYQAKWAADERAKLKEKETPEETIARLEKENEELHGKRKQDREQLKAAESAKAAIKGFTKTVTAVIDGDESVPQSWRPFVSEFMGVKNPINEVDIEDRASVRKLTKEGIKKMHQFAQTIIKEYRDGKVKIPDVTTTQETSSTTAEEKKPKTLSEARRLMHESLAGILNRQ